MIRGLGEHNFVTISKKISNPFWKETFKVAKLLTLGYIKKYPVEIIYCNIWSSHLFLKNNALCTRGNFSTLYSHVSMPIDILKADHTFKHTFLSYEEVCTRFGHVDEQQYTSLKYVITSSTSKYGFLLQNRTWGPTKPPVLTQIINLNLTGCNTWSRLLKKDKKHVLVSEQFY